MPSKAELLRANHERIIAWKSQGLDLRAIADRLQVEGLKVDFNAVWRYCKRAGIPTERTAANKDNTPEPAEPSPTLTTLPARVEPPPQPPPEHFPRLDRYRQNVINALQQGCRFNEMWAIFYGGLSMPDVGEQEAAEYAKSVFRYLHPPGPIQSHLFEINPHDQVWPDDKGLVAFGDAQNTANHWTIGDACQGTIILGATGSGKTSGSGRLLADEFVAAGFGGLVLTTKQGEADDWLKLLMRRDRGRDISIIRPDGALRLNILQYESSHPGESAAFTESFIAFFKNLVSAVSNGQPQSIGATFWRQTGDQLLRNLVGCFLMAGETLTLDGLCEFVANAPLHPDAAKDGYWQTLPHFGAILGKAKAAATGPDGIAAFRGIERYWLGSFPKLVPETRSCITIAFEAMVDALLDRNIYNLISAETTLTPESIFNGRIVIVDLPINEYHEAGLLVQAAWKYLFQRAVLRRTDKKWGPRCRPVFLWEDEAQNFLIDFDAEFQRVAREYRVAHVMLTQNINNLFDRYGGDGHAHSKINSLIGTLNTRIFHANGDLATNKWASESIGTADQTKVDTSATPPTYHGINPFKRALFKMMNPPVITVGRKTVREPLVHPHDFNNLRTGGKRNNFIIDAIITQVGRNFESGYPFAVAPINQIILPEKFMPDEEINGCLLR